MYSLKKKGLAKLQEQRLFFVLGEGGASLDTFIEPGKLCCFILKMDRRLYA